MIVFTFILCLNIVLTLFSSIIAGCIYAYTDWSFYKVYSSILFLLLLCQVIEIHDKIILNSFYEFKYVNIFIIILTLIIVGIAVINKNFLALSAVLEEGIYRIVAVLYFQQLLNSDFILIIIISVVFMFNHIYVIYRSPNSITAFLILLILNLSLIFIALYVDVWLCPLIHLMYDLEVIKRQKRR